MSLQTRTLVGIPPIRRDLIERRLYLVPKLDRGDAGCPHHCEFATRMRFTREGARSTCSRWTMPWRRLIVCRGGTSTSWTIICWDIGRFAEGLFEGMKGNGPGLSGSGDGGFDPGRGLDRKAAEAGLRSIFIGFESLNATNLVQRQQEAKSGTELRAGDPAVARPGDHDQRQLRLRVGRR